MQYLERLGRSRRFSLAVGAAIVAAVLAGTVLGIRIWAQRGSRQTIAGSVLPELANAQRLGPVPASTRLTVSLILAVPRGSDAQAIQQPGPGLAPAADEVAVVSAYLRDQGLTVASGGAKSGALAASGTAQQLERVFGTGVSRWLEEKTKRAFFANDAAISLDSSVAADIVAVAGLDNYPLFAPLASAPLPKGTYTPAQLRNAYGTTTLTGSSSCGLVGSGQPCDGSGQSVGVFAVGGFNPRDIVTFDGQGMFGGDPSLPWPNPFKVHVELPLPLVAPGAYPTLVSSCSIAAARCGLAPSHNLLNGTSEVIEEEAELDIEAVQSMAPGSGINVYEAQNSSFGDFAWFLSQEQLSGHDPILSISYEGCESAMPAADLRGLGLLYLEAATAGESVFTGSGDLGKYCAYDPASGYTEGVSFPASALGVTAVGGTTPTISGGGEYLDSAAWDEGNTDPQTATGGGVSTVFGTKVPEVAAPAHFEAFTYGSDSDLWQALEGTSISGPLWAGFSAVFNEYAQAHSLTFMANRKTLGYANAWYSWLAMQHNVLTPFFDVTANNDTDGSQNLYGPAKKGWDYATGWGSYNADNLARDLVPSVHVTANVAAGGAEVSFAGWPYIPGDTVVFGVDTHGPNYTPTVVLCRAMVDSAGEAGCSARYAVSGEHLLGTKLIFSAFEANSPGISTVVSVPATAVAAASVPVEACPIPAGALGGLSVGSVPRAVTLPSLVPLPAGMAVYGTAVPGEGVVYTIGTQGQLCLPGYGSADGGLGVSIVASSSENEPLGVKNGVFATYSAGGAVAGTRTVCPYFAAAFDAEQRLAGDATQACTIGGLTEPIFRSSQVEEQVIPTGVANAYLAIVRIPASTLGGVGATETTYAVVEANVGNVGAAGEVVYCTLGAPLAVDCAASLSYAVLDQLAPRGSISPAAAAAAAQLIQAFVS
jgi:kumamolisin